MGAAAAAVTRLFSLVRARNCACSRFKETFNRLIIDHFIEFFRLDVVNPLTQLLVFGARLLAGRFSLFRGLLRRPILAH
jgi:hypothetical protein